MISLETGIPETLVSAGFSPRLYGFSAIDAYLGRKPLPWMWVEIDADIAALARLFEDLRFPGVAVADAALETGAAGKTAVWYFRCRDPEEDAGQGARHPAYRLLSFSRDWRTGRFRDPGGLYPLLRAFLGKPVKPAPPWWTGLNPRSGRRRALMDAALILSRYGLGAGEAGPPMEPLRQPLQALPEDSPPLEAQRVLLMALLVSPRPGWGLEFLKTAGFVEEFWPELARLDQVDHSKEYHPEGNVWNHTLETFRYRKNSADPLLSLALLLHDIGKPLAASSGARRFDGHAELGARAGRRFLERLGFPPVLVSQVFYLVKNHMLPAALPRLPLAVTGEILESPLFPTLLELYRCDESSSFKRLEGYYESAAAYRTYLKRRRRL